MIDPDLETWQQGVSLGATGRSGAAWQLLEPLIQRGGPIGSLAASTSASLHRQLGRHLHARGLDEFALAVVTPFADAGREATLDALTGLAADAVGVGDLSTANARMLQATEYLRAELWRANVRIRWVRAEIALLSADPTTALAHAIESVELAAASGSQRHLAKSLLFQGVCERELGLGFDSVKQAIALAEGVNALPLLWPAYSLLADPLLADPLLADTLFADTKASEVIDLIAADLPEPIRREWLAAPDIVRIRAQVRS